MADFNQWAIVELMGHVRIAGLVTEEERFGSKLGRVDIHHGDQVVTQYFHANSVYRITPCTEEVARNVAKSCSPAPVHSWEYPKPALPAPVASYHQDDGLEEEFDDPNYDDYGR